jgi:hypothetical protein
MTPEEAKQRLRDGLPLIVRRIPIYTVRYTGYGGKGGRRFDEELAWIGSETLATAIGTNLGSELAKVVPRWFVELTNPDEPEGSRIPVYQPKLGSTDYFEVLETLEEMHGDILGLMTDEQAGVIMTILVPRLGLQRADGESALIPPPEDLGDPDDPGPGPGPGPG